LVVGLPQLRCGRDARSSRPPSLRLRQSRVGGRTSSAALRAGRSFLTPTLAAPSSVLQPDVEGLLQVVLRVGLESDVRLGPQHAGHLAELVGDHIGQVVVLAHASDGHQVDVAGNRVHLTDAREVRDLLGDLRDAGDVVVDEDDASQHAAIMTHCRLIRRWARGAARRHVPDTRAEPVPPRRPRGGPPAARARRRSAPSPPREPRRRQPPEPAPPRPRPAVRRPPASDPRPHARRPSRRVGRTWPGRTPTLPTPDGAPRESPVSRRAGAAVRRAVRPAAVPPGGPAGSLPPRTAAGAPTRRSSRATAPLRRRPGPEVPPGPAGPRCDRARRSDRPRTARRIGSSRRAHRRWLRREVPGGAGTCTGEPGPPPAAPRGPTWRPGDSRTVRGPRPSPPSPPGEPR